MPVCALDIFNDLLEGAVEAVSEKGSSSRIVEFRVKGPAKQPAPPTTK
jgi:hypothetical protein